MSNFAAKLAELLERRQMRASELSRISGVNDGLISKWINGVQKFVSNDDLASLAQAISPSPKDRAELIKAHLLDEMAGSGSELIEVRIRGHNDPVVLQEASPEYRAPALPLKLQRAIDVICRNLTDADVRAVILGMANILEPELNSPQAVAAGKKIVAAVRKEGQSTRPRTEK